jgi:hypothetical protein
MESVHAGMVLYRVRSNLRPYERRRCPERVGLYECQLPAPDAKMKPDFLFMPDSTIYNK